MSKRARGWRALGLFWLAVVLIGGGGAGVLQVLGPPQTAPAGPALAAAGHAATTPPPRPSAPFAGLGIGGLAGGTRPGAAAAPGAPGPAAMATPPGPPRPIVIAAPDPALLEPSTQFPGGMLPRRAADGRSPMTVYARAADPRDAGPNGTMPRIALVIDGIGLSQADSQAAIALPGPIDLAVSPYAIQPDALLQAARAAGHELLLSIPMEPQGYPLNDEGAHALLSAASSDANARQLEWALSRFQGYAGATGGLDGLRGERFASVGVQLDAVEDALAARGLLYIDPRGGAPAPTHVAGRSVDLVVDDPPLRAEVEAKLVRLEQLARDRGTAIGLLGPPRPATLERVAAWANGLAAKGIALVPVTAVVPPRAEPATPPPGTPAKAASAVAPT
jgi:polysaccharide deacetylase 2 family uncharacterized protein YibQ